MKLAFVVSFFSLLLYAMALVGLQYWALHRASQALQAHNFEGAMAYMEQARREWPQFYHHRASALCSEVTLARARHLVEGSQPDFAGAVSLTRGLATQCEATDREGEVTRFIEHLATQHLAGATARCQQQAYTDALADFQHLATLAYPERTLAQAHQEAVQCRLALANSLAQQQLFEAALEQLGRVISMDNGLVRTVALQQITAVIEDEMQERLRRQHYPQAFKQLAKYQQQFEAYPDTASFLAELGSQVEYQIFGVVRSRPCRMPAAPQRESVQEVRRGPDKRVKQKPGPARPPGPFLVATMPGAGASDDAIPANLALQNTTPHRLQVLLRGLEQRDVSLDPQATQSLQLEPSEYVALVYAPGNCQVKPTRSTWTIRPWSPLGVRFYQ